MVAFQTPSELSYNRGLIASPKEFAREHGAAAWLFMCGDEFATMEGGMSYASAEAVGAEGVQLPAAPPRDFDMEIARRGVDALDDLPRPTVVTCRTGPRSSALVYLYAGLQAGVSPEDVFARAEEDDAAFVKSDELRAWVANGLEQLS